MDVYCASWTSIYRGTDLDAKKAILEIRQEMNDKSYTNPVQSITTKYTLTLPRSRNGSDVNNMNVVDGQTGDKPKVETNRLIPPRSRSGSVVDGVASRMLRL